MADSVSQPALSLHEIKGVVTKFMRMLFPLEFRVDSLTNSSVMLPFHYPLMAGEMIYLPERIDSLELIYAGPAGKATLAVQP